VIQKGCNMNISTCTKIILFLMFIFAAGGCSTIVTHAEKETPAPYAGTKSAIKKIKQSWYHYDIYGQVYLYIIDTPFSFIADTLLYPLDAYRIEQAQPVR